MDPVTLDFLSCLTYTQMTYDSLTASLAAAKATGRCPPLSSQSQSQMQHQHPTSNIQHPFKRTNREQLRQAKQRRNGDKRQERGELPSHTDTCFLPSFLALHKHRYRRNIFSLVSLLLIHMLYEVSLCWLKQTHAESLKWSEEKNPSCALMSMASASAMPKSHPNASASTAQLQHQYLYLFFHLNSAVLLLTLTMNCPVWNCIKCAEDTFTRSGVLFTACDLTWGLAKSKNAIKNQSNQPSSRSKYSHHQ